MKPDIQEKPMSKNAAYSVFFIFFVMGIVSIYVTVDFFIEMYSQILTNQDQVTLDKGIYYLFGGGAFFVLMGLGIFITKVFKVAEIIEKILVALMVFSIFLIFALPQIVHFTVDSYLEGEGYQICQEQSHRWLYVVTIVYTKTLPCSDE